MAKKSSLKRPEYQDDFDFSEMMSYAGEDEAMLGMMNGLVDEGHHQLEMAFQLTKLIVEKANHSGMNTDEIFEVFQRASYTINQSSVIRELLEKVNPSC